MQTTLIRMMEWTRTPAHWQMLFAIAAIMAIIGVVGSIRISRRRSRGIYGVVTFGDQIGHLCIRLALFVGIWGALGMCNPPAQGAEHPSNVIELGPVNANGVCASNARLLVTPLQGTQFKREMLQRWGESVLRRQVLPLEVVQHKLGVPDLFWNPVWSWTVPKEDNAEMRLVRRLGGNPREAVEIQFTATKCQ